jgi:beta-galactosidase GanA
VINGNEVEILSTLAKPTVEADSRAFTNVMRHIREVDASNHTVLMMQVENEVGTLGGSRDQSAVANRAFASAVPPELTRYLVTHRDSIYPELRDLWDANGAKTSGTWEQVFGTSPRTDEIFMAWHYARYIHTVTAAGKAAYNIPMYVNTWLAGEDTAPGDYPSGGPQPRVIDIWKAAGNAIDLYTPDIYQPNFAEWCRRYHRAGNPLFIPETNGGATGGANAFYALGEGGALGISPFGIDSWNDAENELGKNYRVLGELSPLLIEHQAKGDVHGFVLDKNHPSVTFMLNDFRVEVSLDEIFGSHAEKGFGLLMAMGPNEFLGAGQGFRVSFQSGKEGAAKVGLASVDEGRFQDGKWTGRRRLNGDENDQGRYWRFDQRQINIEKAMLYRYK